MVGVVGANMHDLTGQRYGRLTCLRWESRHMTSRREIFWEVECDCGTVKWVKSQVLRSGKAMSCGCLKNEMAGARLRTHGLSNTDEYKIYKGIKKRCYNIEAHAYENYGGRGIVMSDEWLDIKTGFLTFLEEMGKRPSKKHSVERKNVNGNYCKENCHWADMQQQAFNQRVKSSNKSTGVLGISLTPAGKYKVRVGTKEGRKYLGTFETIEKALEVLQSAEIEYWGMLRDRSTGKRGKYE